MRSSVGWTFFQKVVVFVLCFLWFPGKISSVLLYSGFRKCIFFLARGPLFSFEFLY